MRKILLTFLLFGQAYASHWDTEYWQFFGWNQWKCGKYEIYGNLEFRFDHDCSFLYYTRFSENFRYRVKPYLDLEAHYSYIHSKSIGAKHFNNITRLEFESNPHANWGPYGFYWRNRFEILLTQNNPDPIYIYRHRSLFNYEIDDHWSYQMLDEVFYEFNISKFTQNRFTPIQMVYKLDCDLTLATFFMIRNHYSHTLDKWLNSVVFGSQLIF